MKRYKQVDLSDEVAYKFKDEGFDCGSVEGYIDATNYCYQNMFLKRVE
ncbi:hypothetical protein [Vibrio tasmaniensis]|nr:MULTISPECIES: hypothetical protein [Vibrio]